MGNADLQKALDELAIDAIRTLSVLLPLAFALTAPVPFIRFPLGTALRLLPIHLSGVVALLPFTFAAFRNRIPLRKAQATLAAVFTIPIVVQVLQSIVAYNTDRLGTYALFIVGFGLFCLSAEWLVFLIALAVGGWALVVLVNHGAGPTATESILPLSTAILVAIIARTTRMNGVIRLQEISRLDREHLRRAQESEQNFRGIVSRIYDIFFRTNLEGTIQMLSPSIERYGYRVEDLLGKSALPFYADISAREELLHLLMEEGYVKDREVRFRRRDGGMVIATMSITPLRDADGRVIGLEGLLHDVTERRLEEERRITDAEDAAVLAHVGQELIASLDEPILLNRLCELTAHAFGSDASHTFLLGEEHVVIAAGFGDSAEQKESLHVLRIPRDMVGSLVVRLDEDGVVQTVAEDPQGSAIALLPPGYGITHALYFPLRRGDEIVGFQSAAYRGRKDPLPQRKLELARRIAYLASLALANARLVQALEQANEFKTRFLANMSHELRTPLNVIMGYNQILLDHGCGPLTSAQESMLERVQTNASELLNLVCATLELSREETRSIPLDLQDVDIRNLLESLMEERRTLAVKRNLDLSFHVPEEFPTVRTDVRKLRIVLKNLIDNAMKFTCEGSVTVSVGRDRGGVLFRVDDTGIGIDPDDLAVVFEPFRQGSSSGSLDGVGLGLHIVRTLLNVLRGAVEVQSEPGQGSSFRVWLPWRIDGESPTSPEDGIVA